MIERILLATDLSPGAQVAFVHALRLAVACPARLTIVHAGTRATHAAFPSVGAKLADWRASLRGPVVLTTEWRGGLADALFGSTTERLVIAARTAVPAVPTPT